MSARPQFDLSYLSLNPAALNSFLAPYTDTITTSKLLPGNVIRYSYYNQVNQLPKSAIEDPDVKGPFVFQPFSEAEKSVAKSILSMLQTNTGLTFEEVPAGQGVLRFGKYNMKAGFAGYTYNPGDFSEGYTPLFINTTLDANPRAFTQTFLHELGHALNFKHPGLYSADDTNPVLPANLDSSLLTVMTYSDYEYNASYSPLDLAALIKLFGQNTTPTPMTYAFSASGDVAQQRLEGNTYHINMVKQDVFWVVNGPHTFDFSRAAQGNMGLYVDAGLGAVRWSNALDWVTISAWQANQTNSIETITRITDFANVRVYSPNAKASGTTFASFDGVLNADTLKSTLILSDNDDMVLMLEGESVFNAVNTGQGNDRIIGFTDGGLIQGGSGRDELQLFGLRNDYQILRLDAGLQISDSSQQSFVIQEVERLHFDNFSLALDYDGAAGQIYRTYSIFGRAPDEEGMGYWLELMDEGLEQDGLVFFMMQTDEYTSLYNSASNSEFVDKLYANTLERQADAAGHNYWTSLLNSGVGRETVIMEVTESQESVALHANVASMGMPYYEWDILRQL